MRKSIFKNMIAQTQDGKLSTEGQLDDFILDAIKYASDVDDYMSAIDYGIKQLQRAKLPTKDLDGCMALDDDKTVNEVQAEIARLNKELTDDQAIAFLESCVNNVVKMPPNIRGHK